MIPAGWGGRAGRAALGLCIVVFCLGAAVLTGWTLNLESFKSFLSGSVAMKPNAALGFLLCGMGLGALVWCPSSVAVRRMVTTLGLAVLLFFGLTLSQDIGGWDLGLDQWLFVDTISSIRSLPGRVSPPGALCFVLMGMALLMAARPASTPTRLATLSSLATAMMIVAGLAIGSHFFNRYLGTEVWSFSPLAVDTALGFLLLGIALLALVQAEGRWRWAMDRLTTTAFVAGILSLLVAAGTAYNLTRQLQQNAVMLNQMQDVIDLVEQVRSDVADGASAVRGYVITGDERLAQRKEQKFAGVSQRLQALRKQLSGFADQLARVTQLETMLENRRRLADELVVTRRSHGFEAAKKEVLASNGLAQTDVFQQMVDALRDAQVRRLDELQQRSVQVVRQTFLILPLGVFISVTVLLLALFKLNDGVSARKQAEEDRHASDVLFKAIFDASPDGIIVTDISSTIVMANPGAERIFGYGPDAMTGLSVLSLAPAVRGEGMQGERSVLVDHSAQPVLGRAWQLEGQRRDGSLVPMEVIRSAFLTSRGAFVVGVTRDITDRLQAEKRNQRLTNFYAALSQTNQAVVHVTDSETLYQDICRICVKYGHAKVAMISLVKGDCAQPEVFSGPAEAYVDGLVLPLDASLPDGNSFVAQAVRSGKTQICHNFFSDPQTLPWRERVRYLDTRSLAVFPFRRNGMVTGTLSLQMPERDFFTPELISLLEEMMGDLSFALDNMDRDAARTLAESALRDSEQRIRNLFERAVDGIFVLADDQRYLEANPAGLAMLGYSLDELLQMSIQDVLAHEELVRLATRISSAPSDAPHVEEWWHRRKDGTTFAAEVSTSVLPDQRFLAIVRDVTERKHAEARIEYLANHDALTGLPNRTLMRDRITQAINHAKRGGRQLALMYLDLDRFKVINDGYGHPLGDLLLKATGERLMQAVREGDTVARQSGDEFLILLADLRKFSDAHIVCQKILAAFEQPFQLGDREVYITLSIGVSVYPKNGENADELISHADVAMYRSKELGRSTYQFFTEEMSVATQQQVELETRLRMAIAHDELHLVYQPKVDLHTGRILGCEALLRWNHPELGPVSPARFIPIAEDSGLIVLIGDWVLRTACQQGKAWLDAGLPPVVMSVNLSARQFLQQDVVRWVFGALESTQLAPELLELELTESLIAQDTEKVIATVMQLKAAGVKLSIDDFGTGYSSLSYLRRFRVDTLKIDQSFIRDMLNGAEDAAIPLAVISMAHSLRLKVIAEGVETVEQCDFLRDNGCDEIQGYFFSKPVPAAEFEHLLRSDKRLPSRDFSR